MAIKVEEFIQQYITNFYEECDKQPKPVETNKELFECKNCLEEVPFDQTYESKCGHRLCKNCWKFNFEQVS